MTSSLQVSMMNGHSVGTTHEPVFLRRMPSYSENMPPARVSQPQCTPDYMGKQYDEAYFSYQAQGKGMTAFPVPWSSTEGSVVDKSPVSHFSGIDRRHIYRKDSSSEEIHPTHINSPTARGLTLCSKCPDLSSPQATTSVIVRNDQASAERLPADRPVYLTVPPALYRHSPCCTDLCCGLGQSSNPVYERSWKPVEPAELLLHQRRLQTEGMSLCSPGQTHSLPAVLNQTGSPAKAKEVSHRLQCSPRAFPSLYPSQPTYEPVIYHNRSPVSKYGQAPQHPAYYYSPTNVEVEKRTESKNTGPKNTQEIPVVLKHPMQPPPIHYMPPSSLPRFEAIPVPSYLSGINYSGYFSPRLNLNTSPIHTHLKHPHALHSDYINSSPKHAHHPIVNLPSVHKDKSTPQADHSSSFVRMEQTSPSTCSRKPSIPKSSAESHSRHGPPQHSVHLGSPVGRIPGAPPPIVAPDHLGFNIRPSRHHAYQFQPFLGHPPISPTHPALSNKATNQKILYCPPVPVVVKSVPRKPPPPYLHKGPLKRAQPASSPIRIPDEDDVYAVETDLKRQRTEHGDRRNKETSPPMPVINNVFSLAPYQTYIQLARMHLNALNQRNVQNSPERIRGQVSDEHMRAALLRDNLKEAAPEKEMLNTLRMKHLYKCTEPTVHRREVASNPPSLKITIKQEKPDSIPQCVQSSKPREEVKVKQESPDEPFNVCAAMSKTPLVDPHKERPNQENTETSISESKDEQDDLTDQRSSCSEPSELKIIKKESEDIDATDDEHVLDNKKCEPDFEHNVEAKSGSESGQKSSPRELTPTRSPPPAPPAPPHPDGKVSFHNIPPQCLKLSTYNIILPEANLPRTVQICASKSPVKSPTLPSLPPLPLIPLQMPPRKHFLVLHQSLVKLISKSVAATPEETLKSWLSRMELSHRVSGKSQKVSCLFGEKGKEACLNEEMKSSLQQVVQRLNEYTAQEHCPFPFVVRTGAIFLPMLVVKEVLFPTVHGALIDQALQVHKVELRPTTLSEEKTLIQMHKRPCSSRLRRLMSLKHLPDVYVDVVNLFYYTCVCQQLESPSCEVQSSVQD